MAIVRPRTMKGVMELLPPEQRAFQHMLDRIRAGFERFGFGPIETPLMELSELLLSKSGGETERQVYFAQGTGALAQGKAPELALRFDLTVPLARYVAQHEGKLSFPFRRYQMQRVYRGERPQRGRFREFLQCDIDIITRESLSLAYDAELPAVIAGIFADLKIGAFTIQINNRKLLIGFLNALGLEDPERRLSLLREIDKLDKRGRDYLLQSLSKPPISLSPQQLERLFGFLELEGENEEILSALEEMKLEEPLFLEGLRELREVVESLKGYRLPAGRCAIKLSIARGLDYYTGTIYETLLDAHPEIGSICSGGRYDDLLAHYSKRRMPGVGISIGATRLFDQLRRVGLLKSLELGVDVLVARLDAQIHPNSQRFAQDLRAQGLSVELLMEPWKLNRQFKYANKIGARFVLLQGESERDRKVVALKDMRQKSQEELPQEGFIESLARRLG